MKKPLESIKQPGFTVPDAYFDSLGEQVMQGVALESRLGKMRANQGFDVPRAYFDELEKKVLQKTTPSKPKLIPLHRRRFVRYALGAVAALLLVFALNNLPVQQVFEIHNLDDNTLAEYVEGNLTDYELENLFSTEEIGLSDLNFSQAEILDYLGDFQYADLLMSE